MEVIRTCKEDEEGKGNDNEKEEDEGYLDL